jgi:hypothetical protein
VYRSIIRLMVFFAAVTVTSLVARAENVTGIESSMPNILENYKIAHRTCSIRGQDYLLLREFEMNGHAAGLVVNTLSLKTELVALSAVSCLSPTSISVRSNYDMILDEATETPEALVAGGLAFGRSKNNIYLTVDLCPSSRPFEPALFSFLTGVSEKIGRALPIAFSLSGTWMLRHSSELKQLETLAKQGEIIPVWINHTLHHNYDPKEPIENNFLMLPGVNIEDEIIGQEKLMIESGLTPSIFMRFPGLISSQKELNFVRGLGLIPVGASAWLAKTENFNFGDIILIHGNGNEKVGIIDLFFKLIDFRVASLPWQNLENWGLDLR